MPCYHPAEAYYKKGGGITLARSLSNTQVSFKLPCGQCIGCRLEKARQWKMRLLHESRMHRDNQFVTLTYDNEKLPMAGTLVPRHLQLFFKKLRNHHGKLRFFSVGEYGDLNQRPHYHAIVFGLHLADRRRHGKSQTGQDIFRSDALARCWDHGFSTTQHVDAGSCAYVARYAVKKITGKKADEHYTVIDEHGNPYRRHPEFARMSNRPGIGRSYYEKFGAEALQHDSVIVNGRESPTPAYYLRISEHRTDTVHEQVKRTHRPDRKLFADETVSQEIKKRRVTKARSQRADQTPERLAVREAVAKAKAKHQKRTL